MPEAFYTVEEAAERLRMHPDTLRRQLRQGRIRSVRTGKLWRIPESALEAPGIEAAAPSGQDQSMPLYPPQFPSGAEVEERDLTALFAPPTPAEIARRLAALDSIKRGSIASDPAAPEVDLEADPWGYEERADSLRESHQ